MRTIAITNQKGGSGKTTTAVNLAAALAELGTRILVLDLDPQASASSWLGVANGGRGLLDVLTGTERLADVVVNTSIAGIDLIPTSRQLAGAELVLAGEPGAQVVLRDAIASLPARWDYLLIDCPPQLSFLTVAALVACDEVLVPVEASAMALQGLADLVQTLEKVKRLNASLAIGAILACRVDARTNLSRDVVDRLRDRFGAVVLDTVIRETVRLREAPSHREAITVYAPSSTGAEDYRAAAHELLQRHGANSPRRRS